jgi:hypothetical protein
MIFDPSNLFQQLNISLLIKITLLVLIGMYTVFSLMLANKIRSFNKILFLPTRSGGNLMQKAALIYSIIVFILFILTLIMV